MDDVRSEPTRHYRWLTAAGFVVAVGYTCYLAMGTNVFGKLPWPEAVVDYHIIYECGLQIVESNEYPPKHAYPPSAIAIHYLLAQLPYVWSAAVFLALTILATLACGALLLRFVPEAGRPGWLVLIVPVMAVSQYYILWDLRSQNCNIIVFACTLAGVNALHRDRPLSAGFWIALGFSLKLFSVLLIPYLLWRGNVRAFLWTLAFVVVFWLLLPLVIFTPDGMIATYQNWLEVMRNVGTAKPDVNHPILISLHNAGYWLFDGDALAIGWFTNGFRLAWVIVGLVAMMASLRLWRTRTDAHGLLTDVAVLLLGPAAVSPYLEPYHAIPFILPAFLLIEAATDWRQTARLRLLAGIVFVAMLVVRPAVAPFAYRGVPVNLLLLLATTSAIVVASVRRREAEDCDALAEHTTASPGFLAARQS